MHRALLLAAVFSVLAAGCSKEPAAPPPPPAEPVQLPPLPEGSARLTPDASYVDQGGHVDVLVEVNTGSETLGATSMALTYDSSAFEVHAVTGLDPVLGAPAHSSQPLPGRLYLAFMNSTEPETTLRGLLKVAKIRFRPIGPSGSRLGLHGELLTLGDTQFPAARIGGQGFPRQMEVVHSVVLR